MCDVTEYRVLTAYSSRNLEEMVQTLLCDPENPLDDSWRLHGHMQVVTKSQQYTYAGNQPRTVQYQNKYVQAMVRVSE